MVEIALGLLALAIALVAVWYLMVPSAVPVATTVGPLPDVDDLHPLPNLVLAPAAQAGPLPDIDDLHPLPNLALPPAAQAGPLPDIDDLHPLPNLALPY